jgi:hypothetical protein
MSARTGSLPWVPPALLIASALALDVALTMGVLVLPVAQERGGGGAGVLSGMLWAFGVAAGVLLVVGAVLAFRWAGREEPTFVGWYTVALLVLGVLGVLTLLLFEWMIHRSAATAPNNPVHAFRFVQAVVAAYSSAMLIAAVLRAVRSRLAAAWTTCVSICLLFNVPFGTVVGIAWLVSVRSRETSPS